MDGRLNLFQRMMLRWRQLHPYNPVHVICIPGSLDRARLRADIGRRLELLGLTGLVIDEARSRYRYEGGPANVDLRVLPGGIDPLATLRAEIERQFNSPFPWGPNASPFRFFCVEAAQEFHLALAYDHFAAGGDSVALLLLGIAETYVAPEAASRVPPIERYPSTYRTVFRRHPLWGLRSVVGLPAMISRSRKAFRPSNARPDDAYNAFTYVRLAPSQLRTLVAAGKAWGVTVNDLLMASLLRSLSPVAEARRRAPRRRELAVASIMNVRHEFDAGARNALSPFLASFRIAHLVPEGIGLRELVADVHAETDRLKRNRLYLQGIVALGLSALLWPLLSSERRHRFYPKHYPAFAGITTLNVNAVWERAGHGAPRFDYLRAVPTGPLCPMVFAVTTARDVMHVGVAFRRAVFSHATVDEVAAEFVRCIQSLQEEVPA